MKSTRFEQQEPAPASVASLLDIQRLYPPDAGERAAMLEGSNEEVAAKVVAILVEKGVAK